MSDDSHPCKTTTYELDFDRSTCIYRDVRKMDDFKGDGCQFTYSV